jgi:ParB family chromosome partitioning protein
VALIENIQRETLNALEEADAYAQLLETYGHTQEALAGLVGKSRSHVANLLRLRDLPEFVRDALRRGDINMGHARAVASADDPEALTREIITKGLNVRQAEQLAKAVRPGPGSDIARGVARQAANAPVDADVAALERQLGDILGLRVKVAARGGSGTVTLHFSTLDQLDLVCQRLSGEPI